MKTLQRRIQQAAKEARVSQFIVERDYAQGYVLLGLASRPELGSYRFSEDLDFSAVDSPRGAELEQVVQAAVNAARSAARQLAPVSLTVERYEERDPHPGGQEAFIVRVQFPWQRRPMVRVKMLLKLQASGRHDPAGPSSSRRMPSVMCRRYREVSPPGQKDINEKGWTFRPRASHQIIEATTPGFPVTERKLRWHVACERDRDCPCERFAWLMPCASRSPASGAEAGPRMGTPASPAIGVLYA